jgi:hypothetical protein
VKGQEQQREQEYQRLINDYGFAMETPPGGPS